MKKKIRCNTRILDEKHAAVSKEAVGGMNWLTGLTRRAIPRSLAYLPLTPSVEPLSNLSMLFWERRREILQVLSTLPRYSGCAAGMGIQ